METLFNKMENIVNQYVKHYKGDFKIDKEIITEIARRKEQEENSEKPYERFLFWIVREHGTNIGYLSKIADSVLYDYYIEADVRYYELDLEKQTVKIIKEPIAYRNKRRLHNELLYSRPSHLL